MPKVFVCAPLAAAGVSLGRLAIALALALVRVCGVGRDGEHAGAPSLLGLLAELAFGHLKLGVLIRLDLVVVDRPGAAGGLEAAGELALCPVPVRRPALAAVCHTGAARRAAGGLGAPAAAGGGVGGRG